MTKCDGWEDFEHETDRPLVKVVFLPLPQDGGLRFGPLHLCPQCIQDLRDDEFNIEDVDYKLVRGAE